MGLNPMQRNTRIESEGHAVHNTMLHNVLHCIVTFALILVAMQCNSKIDSDPILTFLCVAFLICVRSSKIAKIFILSKARSLIGLNRGLFGFFASF